MQILINDLIADEGVNIFEEKGYQTHTHHYEDDELCECIHTYDALIVRSQTEVNDKIISKADRLKIIGRAGIGYDNIDKEAASGRGIIIKNAPHGNTNAAAEHTVNLMLAVSRYGPQHYHSLKKFRWSKGRYPGQELSGKVTGIIGCGRIGQRVGEILYHGFDMRILGNDKEEKDIGFIDFVDKKYLLAKSDYVTLHLPGQDEPVISFQEFDQMKDGAYLINVSRGCNLDEDAMEKALQGGKLAGAALDVHQKEGGGGKYKNRFIGYENVVLTPHIGAGTEEAQKKTGQEIASVVSDYLDHGDWKNAVNVEAHTGTTMAKEDTHKLYVYHRNEPGVYKAVTDKMAEAKCNIEGVSDALLDNGSKLAIFMLTGKDDYSALIKQIYQVDNVLRAVD